MKNRTETTEATREELVGRLDLQLEALLELVFALERAASREDRLQAAIHYTPATSRQRS